MPIVKFLLCFTFVKLLLADCGIIYCWTSGYTLPVASLALGGASCRLLGDAHTSTSDDSSLFSSLMRSRSSVHLYESRVAHFSDAPTALCNSVSGKEHLCESDHV